MTKFRGILIFGLLFEVFVHSGNSQECNTAEEDSSLCEIVQIPGFGSMAELFINIFMGSISKNFTETIVNSLNRCDFDSTNDTTIAKSFKFILFKPNSAEPEYIDGNDLLNGCDALKTGAGSTKKTIWLWPGWLNNCSIDNKEGDYSWTVDHAPRLAKQANAQVIAIDWGSSKLSCCSYPMLLYCYMDTISEWMAKVVQTCSSIAPSTSISNTWLIGHSLGAQFVGYTAKALQTPTTKVEKVIGLDPAGPLFQTKNGGKCQGVQRKYANDTMIFSTNSGVLGTKNYGFAAVNVYVNRKRKFCQHGCKCDDASCNHIYANKILLKALADDEQIRATKFNDRKKRSKYNVTIYKTMQPGFYDIKSSENPPLQKVETNQ